ncbi:MAG: FixH family protein [Hyphomicrobiaceae bacterium]
MTAERGTITGWHVLLGVIAFFAVVFAVNGYFMYAALSSYTGVVSKEPYRKGLAYNERIAEDERQHELGWTTHFDIGAGHVLTLRLADRSAQALRGLAVTGKIGRPSTNKFDAKLAFVEIAPGTYEARPQGLSDGAWFADVEVRARADALDPVYRLRRRLWLKP